MLFNRRLVIHRIKKLLIPGVAIAFIAIVISALYFWGFRFNYSTSMPIGVYRLVSGAVKRGNSVVADLRGVPKYKRNNGSLVLFNDRVLKQVIGVPGDTVVLSDNKVVVNGKIYPGKIHKKGSGRQELVHKIKPGKYKINGYWLYGAGNADPSWDSRYFGPVGKDRIIGKCKPVFIVR